MDNKDPQIHTKEKSLIHSDRRLVKELVERKEFQTKLWNMVFLIMIVHMSLFGFRCFHLLVVNVEILHARTRIINADTDLEDIPSHSIRSTKLIDWVLNWPRKPCL